MSDIENNLDTRKEWPELAAVAVRQLERAQLLHVVSGL